MADVRLIDANALKARLRSLVATGGHKYYRKGMDDTLHHHMPNIIDDQPTVDVHPVVHGRWERFETISGNIGVLCSDCNWRDYNHGRFNGNLFSYCPHCGAKMDLEVADNA